VRSIILMLLVSSCGTDEQETTCKCPPHEPVDKQKAVEEIEEPEIDVAICFIKTPQYRWICDLPGYARRCTYPKAEIDAHVEYFVARVKTVTNELQQLDAQAEIETKQAEILELKRAANIMARMGCWDAAPYKLPPGTHYPPRPSPYTWMSGRVTSYESEGFY